MIPNYDIKYSNRKTISIRINNKWQLLVWAPVWINEKRVHKFVESKEIWITEKIDYMKKLVVEEPITITEEMKSHAFIQIVPRIEYYANIMNVNKYYTDIKITAAKTKWWSCSNKWVLMFHWKLSNFPISIVDYVIVHELAHLVHFNHSKNFRKLVEQYYPNYKEAKKRLQQNWNNTKIF